MASVDILLIVIVIFISVGEGKTFINVECKTENRALYGQSSLLECVVKTTQEVEDVQIRVVTWKKKGVEEPLLVFNKGKMKKHNLTTRYSFAEPSWNDKNMNVSLLIADTTVEDEGVYDCMVMTNTGDNTNHTNLSVTAKYSGPTINPTPKKITRNTDGTLVCNADGGYPQGQLRWFVGDMEWTNSVDMEVKKTGHGLFHLSSSLKVMSGSAFSEFTCILFNASGGKEDGATFVIEPEKDGHGQDNLSDSASKIVAPVVVIGSLIAGLLLVLVLFNRRRHQRDHREVRTCESDVEGGDHQDKDIKCQDSLA